MHRDQEIGEHLYAGLINHQPVFNYFAIKIALCLEKKALVVKQLTNFTLWSLIHTWVTVAQKGIQMKETN